MHLVCPYSQTSSLLLSILQHIFTMALNPSFKEQWVRLAFTTVTPHIDVLDKSKIQSLDTAGSAATAKKSQAQASGLSF